MRIQKRYDHRLRDLVRDSRDVTLATRLGVPRSTAASWLAQGGDAVISHERSPMPRADLEAELLHLRARLEALLTLLRALVAMLRALGIDLRRSRVPDGPARLRLVRAIDRATDRRGRRRTLALLGVTPARLRSWRTSTGDCELPETERCPRRSPRRLTPDEIVAMRTLVTSPEHRHVSTGTLALLAQRQGKLFASPSTWYRWVRVRGWRRPRRRVYPEKPTVGARAEAPDALWHIDTTILRLVDGTRATIHAVIDNFSRRILAWCVADRLDVRNSVAVLLAAAGSRSRGAGCPLVVADAGVENVNEEVDRLIGDGLLRRVIAQTEIRSSNSMIEAWWRTLKHQWLFLNPIESVEKLRKLVEFYVEEHNTRLPHSAFRGQTPDEMYFGTGDGIPEELERRRVQARQVRLEANRRSTCARCEEVGAA
jgi:hypothetical protein